MKGAGYWDVEILCFTHHCPSYYSLAPVIPWPASLSVLQLPWKFSQSWSWLTPSRPPFCVSMRNCGNICILEIFSQHTTFHIPVILGHHQAWRPSRLGRSYTLTSVCLVFFSALFLLVFLCSFFICFHSLSSWRICLGANSVKPHVQTSSTMNSHNSALGQASELVDPKGSVMSVNIWFPFLYSANSQCLFHPLSPGSTRLLYDGCRLVKDSRLI